MWRWSVLAAADPRPGAGGRQPGYWGALEGYRGVLGGTGGTATRLILLQSLSNLPDPSAYIFSTIKPVRGICTLFVKITFDCYVFVPLYPPVGSKYCMYLDCWRRRVFHTAFSPVMDGFYFFLLCPPVILQNCQFSLSPPQWK